MKTRRTRKMEHKSRHDRKMDMLRYLFDNKVALSREQWRTAAAIAHAVGMVPSSHVRRMLAELEADGVLTSWVVPHRSNAIVRRWAIADYRQLSLMELLNG